MWIQPRSTVRLVIRLGVLLLGLSVFNWALQARLPATTAHSSPLTRTARLSTDKAAGDSIELRVVNLDQGPTAVLPRASCAALLFRGHVVKTSGLREVELSLSGPHRYDLLGPHRLHRPPPAHG